jgi:hypothetical protein
MESPILLHPWTYTEREIPKKLRERYDAGISGMVYASG